MGGAAAGGSGGVGGAGGVAQDAGPVGELTCAEYCKYLTLNCFGIDAMYKDEAACLAACPAIPVGTLADQTGNTLGCRLHHAHAALTLPAGECSAAGPGGDGICGDNCGGFCQLALKFCPAIWSDEQACRVDCATFDATTWYSANIVTGNSLACRLFYATMAAQDHSHCEAIKKASVTCVDL